MGNPQTILSYCAFQVYSFLSGIPTFKDYVFDHKDNKQNDSFESVVTINKKVWLWNSNNPLTICKFIYHNSSYFVEFGYSPQVLNITEYTTFTKQFEMVPKPPAQLATGTYFQYKPVQSIEDHNIISSELLEFANTFSDLVASKLIEHYIHAHLPDPWSALARLATLLENIHCAQEAPYTLDM
jgi:hypothetical protein